MGQGSQNGISNNPRGRPKGAIDRMTLQVKQTIVQFVNDNIEGIQDDFDTLDPKDKLIFIEKMLGYVIPRQQQNNLTGDVNFNQINLQLNNPDVKIQLENE